MGEAVLLSDSDARLQTTLRETDPRFWTLALTGLLNAETAHAVRDALTVALHLRKARKLDRRILIDARGVVPGSVCFSEPPALGRPGLPELIDPTATALVEALATNSWAASAFAVLALPINGSLICQVTRRLVTGVLPSRAFHVWVPFSDETAARSWILQTSSPSGRGREIAASSRA